MIHLITTANRCLYEDEILECRRIDRARFAGAVPWQAGALVDAGGIDRFDGDDAIYILGIEDGRVCGASCLIPTSKPHRLNDVFPRLASVRGVPCDPAIYEWTPLLADDAPPEDGDRRHVVGSVMCGVVEYCLAEGICAVSGIIDAWSLPRFHDMGWTVRPLGLPEQIGQDWMLAVVMPIDAPTLEATRAFYGIDEPVLMHAGLRPTITREIVL